MKLGGKPILQHPYAFTLMESEYLRKWFSEGEKLVLDLDEIPDDQISFTIGDSCGIGRGAGLFVLRKTAVI